MADSLDVRIVAHDDASATLKRIQGEVTSLHGSMNQMGVVAGAVGGIIATSLTGALSGLSNAIGGAGGSIVGMSSKLEQAGIAFETMLGSAQKAQSFLSDLQDFAAKTPFEFPQLVDASKRMLAFGFAAEEVRPLLTAVGNAASAMGSGAEGINRITTALGQMQAKGKLQAEEMLQLTEAGIPAWDMLAKKLGTDVAGAMDAVTKRTVDAQTFMEAFTTGTAARFGDMMEKQSHTFEGAMSTVKDTIGQLIGGAFGPFFQQISQFADQLAQGLGTDAFGTWAANVQEVLSRLAPLFGQFMDQFKALGPVVQQFVNDNVQGFVAGVQSMGERVLAILPAIGDLFTHLGERIDIGIGHFKPIVEGAAAALGALAEPAGAAVRAIEQMNDALSGKLAEGLERIREPAQTFAAWLGELGGALGDVPQRVFNDLGTAMERVGQSLSTFSDLWSNLMATLGGGGGAVDSVGLISDAVHGLMDALEAFGPIAEEAWRALREDLTNAYVAVQPVLEGLRDWLATNLPPAIATLQEAWTALSNELGPTFNMAWQVLEPILSALKDWLGEQIPRAVEFVKGAIGGLFQLVGGAVSALADLLGPLKDQFGGALHDFNEKVQLALAASRPEIVAEAKTTATAVRQEFIQGTVPLTPALQAAGEEAGQAMVNGVKAGTASAVAAVRATAPAAESAGAEVGAALVQGVEAGMEPHQGAAVSKFQDVVVNIVAGGRAAIQAQSPSALTAEQIGRPMVEGIGVGFTDGMPALASTMQSGLQQVVDDASAYARSAAASVGDLMAGYQNARSPRSRPPTNFELEQRASQFAHMLRIQTTGTDDYADPASFFSWSDTAGALLGSKPGGGGTGGGVGSSTLPLYNPLLGPSANAMIGAGGGGGNASGQFTAGSGFATAPAAFQLGIGSTPSGQRLDTTGWGTPETAAAIAQQYAAFMAANAQALRTNPFTVASVPQAFSAYALHPSPGFGNTGINTGGSGAFQVQGNTPGGVNFGALQALGAQITAAHPDLSAEAQARLIQQGMRTNTEYLRVVGNLSDTGDDLRRQQEDATNQVNNWTNVVQQQGAAYAQGTGAMQSLVDAQQHLTDITNSLAATVTTPTTPTLPTTTLRTPIVPVVTFPGGFPIGPGGGVPLGVNSLPGGSVSGGEVTINMTYNAVAAAGGSPQDMAAFVRQFREEARRQGVDLSRGGGV